MDSRKQTLRPTVMGGSVLGIKYDNGVLLAADTLGSYGSLLRYRDIERLNRLNDHVGLAFAGDIADAQFIQRVLEQLNIDDQVANDGSYLNGRAVHTWLTRVLYNRRCDINPLYNIIAVGGFDNGRPFLGYVNYLGLAFEDDLVSSGYGSHIALPIMRKAIEDKGSLLNREESVQLLNKCLTILYYRDAQSWNNYHIMNIDASGVEISPKQTLIGNWDVANMI